MENLKNTGISAHKTAFIIVCWNNKELLRECFESIRAQTYKNYKIIMLDNASSDESVSYVKEEYPEVILIESRKNTGFAKGNNLAITEAMKDPDVDSVVLLNTDATIAEDWLETILKFADKKPRGACFQGTTLDYYNHEIIDSTHIFMSRNGQATQGNWRKRYGQELGPKKVFGVNAAACLITRKFIETQPFGEELFDETMFMYLEDVDLAARATVMGWDNYLVSHARAFHMGSASSGKRPRFSLYMTFRNNTGLVVKNFPSRIAWRLLIALPRSDYHTIRHLRKLGDKTAARKLIKGRIAGLFFVPIFLAKRNKLKRYRKGQDEYIWSLMKNGY